MGYDEIEIVPEEKARDICTGSSGSSDEPFNNEEVDRCTRCLSSDGGVWTALGCLPVQPETFIEQRVLPIGLGLAGGASLLTIFYAAYLVQTSQGNPEKLKKARSYLTSALTGLLVVIFAIFILQFVGVNLLGIPLG